MLPDSQINLNQHMQFLPHKELSLLDPELFPLENVIEKRVAREALIRKYVDVRSLAYVASGVGDKGLATL